MIGLEPHQRSFHCLTNIQSGETCLIGPITHTSIDFGGDDRLLTSATTLGKPATDDLLRDSLAKFPTVDVGSVEEINAKVNCLVHNGE